MHPSDKANPRQIGQNIKRQQEQPVAQIDLDKIFLYI
jgi:hypothetical protein